ncbi:RluA family pseudouridine synthase [bacterium]|nr:RluA family pseudouridine synthase [bacterium]
MLKTIIVTEETDDRLDNFLSEMFENISRSKFQKLIKSGNVKVNDKPQKASYKVCFKDIIEFEFLESETIEILPENIPLDIVYEDENMLVVNKPSGMLTHPTAQETKGTLVNALLYHYGENLSDINGDLRRGIVHRLDRNTSGLLMVAKNNSAHEFLAQEIKNRNVEKKYIAVVKGNIKDDFGLINEPIGRNPKNPCKMTVVSDGKPSLTGFKVLERFSNCTYVELDLKTGRTHQIRVHMSFINHPVLNDPLYGGTGLKIKTQDQVLQSYKLKFAKPFSGDIINLEIPPDEKFEKVLGWLKGKVKDEN